MKLVFGGIVAVILLGLYAYAVITAILVVSCITTTGCSTLTAGAFTTGYASTLTTVGGLVSALVIAELAITKPGEAPLARTIHGETTPKEKGFLATVTGIYLLVWLGLGLAAYVVGAMWHPETLKPLSDLGQSWLGLAVAAAYAYFGINPGTEAPRGSKVVQ